MMAMVDGSNVGAASAVTDFRRARRRADVQAVLGQLSGQPHELLPYDEVRRRLHAVESAARHLEDIPLSAIVGSVDRYQDFSRGFLPRMDSDRDRWVGVKLAMTGMVGVPPIEVYRIGEAYFVKDGNHRVSVARQLGAATIQAIVTPVHARVPLSPDDDPDDLIIKEEYAGFLEETGLDELRPGADLTVTAPGQYQALGEHIRVHRYFMGIDLDRPVRFDEAVAHWYDEVYLPVVDAIRAHGLLRDFAGRTETDLYLFLAEHRARLETDFGWRLPSQAVAAGLAPARSLHPDERADELLRASRAAAPGERTTVSLVQAVLVLQRGRPLDERALRTAIALARTEGATLYALRLGAGRVSPEVLDEERRHLEELASKAGVPCQFAASDGDPVREVRQRAAYLDLVVAALFDDDEAGRRLAPELKGLLRRCPRPLLVVRDGRTGLRRPLLAYDGGIKSEEALFALTYAALKRDVRPVVMTVAEHGRGVSPLDRARTYLERFGIEATYVSAHGPVAEALREVAELHDCDAIFMGSYKFSRWLEDVVGGILEQVLLDGDVPILVT